MGALPSIKRFLAEDYPSQSAWIGTLLYPLNLLLNTIYSNLNNGLTLQNNQLAQVKTLSLSGTSPTTSFSWSFPATAPIGVLIVQCLQTNGSAAVITNPVTVAWSYSSGTITINNVTGLTTGNTYSCTFIVWGA